MNYYLKMYNSLQRLPDLTCKFCFYTYKFGKTSLLYLQCKLMQLILFEENVSNIYLSILKLNFKNLRMIKAYS